LEIQARLVSRVRRRPKSPFDSFPTLGRDRFFGKGGGGVARGRIRPMSGTAALGGIGSGADILTRDGYGASEFAGMVLRCEVVFFPSDGGLPGIETMLEGIAVTDLAASRATYFSRHETSFTNQSRTRHAEKD